MMATYTKKSYIYRFFDSETGRMIVMICEDTYQSMLREVNKKKKELGDRDYYCNDEVLTFQAPLN